MEQISKASKKRGRAEAFSNDEESIDAIQPRAYKVIRQAPTSLREYLYGLQKIKKENKPHLSAIVKAYRIRNKVPISLKLQAVWL